MKSKKIRKKDFDLLSLCFCFPLFVGIICQMGKNAVCCIVDKKSGQLRLKSYHQKYPLFFHPNIALVRGVEFLFFSILNYTAIFRKNFCEGKKKFEFANNIELLKKIGLKFLQIFAIIALALFFGWGVLGVLPSKLGFWVFPNSYSIFLKNLCIGIFKCVFIILTILLLWTFPKMRSLCRFNTAANLASVGKNFFALNFFNVAFGALLLQVFVITLMGFSGHFLLCVLLNIIVYFFCVSVVFEICLWQEKKGALNQKLCVLTSFLFYGIPSKTEKQVAQGAVMECELMKNEERALVNNENMDGIDLAFVLSDVKNALKKAGIYDFGEAEWLIANVLGVKKLDIRFVKTISKDQKTQIDHALERRVNHEPIDKIFGFTEFFGLKFKVNKNVLTPRQETELLVEKVLGEIAQNKAKVLDLCTGSGAIAISIAKNSKADVLGVDISESALDIAKFNAEKLGADVKFKQSDMFSRIGKKKFDVIVSNPPYIKTDEIALLEKEVKNFDPSLALDGGEDGLYFYRIIASLAPKYLAQKGKLFLEIGKGQGAKLKKLLTDNFENIKILKDYEGAQRIVVATKKG